MTPPSTTHSPRFPANPGSILITALCPIGDTFFLTPALAQVRRRYPNAHITVILSTSNEGVLADNPDIDERILMPERGSAPEPVRFAQGVRRISRLRPDLIINFSAAGSIVSGLALLRAPRLHLQAPPLWTLFGARDEAYRARHAIDHYFKAIEPIIPPPLSAAERVPRYFVTPESRHEARELLRSMNVEPGDIIVTMHVGGDGFNGRKRWAPERFARVANDLIERFNARIFLIGGPADIPLSHAAAAHMRGSINILAGKTSLKLTSALIEASSLFIGNDSSPLHIAAAVNTPSIGIFGPSDWQEFHPVGREGHRSHILHSDLPCSPCFHFVGNTPLWQINTCHSYACLKAIEPRRVMEAAVELLGQATPQRDPAPATP